MLNAKAFANASTIVSVGLYIICRVASLVVPDFLFSIAKSWFHTFSLESIKMSTPLDMGTFLLGAISLAVIVWLTVYVTINLYNRFAK